MTNPEMEEKLREAACFGDIEGVKELISRAVNVNSQHDINGWTALHWAAKRNHLNIVNLLCNHGADKNISTNKGELASQLTTEGVIKVLLNAQSPAPSSRPVAATPKATAKVSPATSRPSPQPQEKLPIQPNYLRHPPLAHQVDIGERSIVDKKARLDVETAGVEDLVTASASSRTRKTVVSQQQQQQKDVIVKVRVAKSSDPDFIEIDLPSSSLTLEYLKTLACEELDIQQSRVERVRKLPNTRMRKDKEVARLQDYQEIELVLRDSSNRMDQ